MDIARYLERINYNEEINTSLNTLSKLMKAHIMAIPFENLDIHKNTPILLANSFNKIIQNRRGGFCYELNGLFYTLLIKLGYNAYLISARVCNTNGTCGAEFDHMAIVVKIGNVEYLVDVGFGDFSISPLKIELETIQETETGTYKISKFNDEYLVVSKNVNQLWINEHIFTLTQRGIGDFEDMLHYHQTNPESHFTQNKICTLPTDLGRITLSGNKLKITMGNESTIKTLGTEDEYNDALIRHFGISLIQ